MHNIVFNRNSRSMLLFVVGLPINRQADNKQQCAGPPIFKHNYQESNSGSGVSKILSPII